MYKEGLRGVNNINPEHLTEGLFTNKEYKLTSVRVLDIILDETHPKFKKYGEWNGIGTIEFENININKLDSLNNPIAIPLNANVKNYPLVNEIVLLFSLPSKKLNNIDIVQTLYYLNTVNIWNHPHHNAFPDIDKYNLSNQSQKQDYKSIEGGSIRRVKDKSTEIQLNSPTIGGTFIEKVNIQPLLSFPGDVIYEGRFGNSMRFGNTSKSKSKIYKNTWSGAGENGDPITIIRNGQNPNSSEEGWSPILEDINKDLTSIWLTSYQNLPLNKVKENYRGVKSPPKQANSYYNPQAAINSSRVILSAYEDFIILLGKKGIALSSEGDIGISTKKNIALDSPNIKIGSVEAEEAPILGDSFMVQFEQLLEGIKNISSVLQELQDWPNGAPVPSLLIPPVAAVLEQVSEEILSLIKDKKRPLLSNKISIE